MIEDKNMLLNSCPQKQISGVCHQEQLNSTILWWKDFVITNGLQYSSPCDKILVNQMALVWHIMVFKSDWNKTLIMIVMTASPQVTLQTVNPTQSRPPPPSPCILIPTSDYLQYLTEPPPLLQIVTCMPQILTPRLLEVVFWHFFMKRSFLSWETSSPCCLVPIFRSRMLGWQNWAATFSNRMNSGKWSRNYSALFLLCLQ